MLTGNYQKREDSQIAIFPIRLAKQLQELDLVMLTEVLMFRSIADVKFNVSPDIWSDFLAQILILVNCV